jgi:hypothetical protein
MRAGARLLRSGLGLSPDKPEVVWRQIDYVSLTFMLTGLVLSFMRAGIRSRLVAQRERAATPGVAGEGLVRREGTRRVAGTYLNGRGEMTQTDCSDLNVPFRLECVLTGRKWWLETAG